MTDNPLQVLSTVLIFEILKVFFVDESEIWRPITAKSQDWLNKILKTGMPRLSGAGINSWAEQYAKDSVKIDISAESQI